MGAEEKGGTTPRIGTRPRRAGIAMRGTFGSRSCTTTTTPGRSSCARTSSSTTATKATSRPAQTEISCPCLSNLAFLRCFQLHIRFLVSLVAVRKAKKIFTRYCHSTLAAGGKSKRAPPAAGLYFKFSRVSGVHIALKKPTQCWQRRAVSTQKAYGHVSQGTVQFEGPMPDLGLSARPDLQTLPRAVLRIQDTCSCGNWKGAGGGHSGCMYGFTCMCGWP